MSRPGSAKRRGALDLVEGWYAGTIVSLLCRNGALAYLANYRTEREIAGKFGWEPVTTRALLQFVHYSCDFLEFAEGRGFRLTTTYRGATPDRFQMLKFIGGFGPLFENMDAVLLRSETDPGTDEDFLAAAFSLIPPRSLAGVATAIAQYKVRSVLEIGCGAAPLLRCLCSEYSNVRGIAADVSRVMCKRLRELVRREGLAGRIAVKRLGSEQILRAGGVGDVDAIYARGVLNSFFGTSPLRIHDVLRGLSRRFPGALLVVDDYYGCLGHVRVPSRSLQKTVIHDLVQTLTGQGVPPADPAAWMRIYGEVGATLLDHQERGIAGSGTFVDFVRLNGTPRRGKKRVART